VEKGIVPLGNTSISLGRSEPVVTLRGNIEVRISPQPACDSDVILAFEHKKALLNIAKISAYS
jgi:hypothetical protein